MSSITSSGTDFGHKCKPWPVSSILFVLSSPYVSDYTSDTLYFLFLSSFCLSLSSPLGIHNLLLDLGLQIDLTLELDPKLGTLLLYVIIISCMNSLIHRIRNIRAVKWCSFLFFFFCWLYYWTHPGLAMWLVAIFLISNWPMLH